MRHENLPRPRRTFECEHHCTTQKRHETTDFPAGRLPQRVTFPSDSCSEQLDPVAGDVDAILILAWLTTQPGEFRRVLIRAAPLLNHSRIKETE